MNPPAAHRLGHPQPLLFHIGWAVSAYLQAIPVAPNAAEPAFPWQPALGPFEGPAPDPLATTAEAIGRLGAMLRGIETWQRAPYRRTAPDVPVVWQSGAARLLDFGRAGDPPVVVLPSLINRAYVLDLTPETSFLRRLAEAGARPLLLDWGPPGSEERTFDLQDYLDRRLSPALDHVAGAIGRPALLGYCMGGTLAAATALCRPGIRALVTIGAPWDFDQAKGSIQAVRAGARHYGIGRLRAQIRALAAAFGTVPVAIFQQLFALIDPIQAARKFRRFAAMDRGDAAAALFVALEDWLADGVPMSGPAAETLLIDWHLENAPALGRWPARPRLPAPPPALVVAGTRDVIAQPGMAIPLAAAYPGAQAILPPLGHVGMIVGATAPDHVLRPVVEFLRSNP